MLPILAAMKAIASQPVSHISLPTDFEQRTGLHGYKHFIRSGIKAPAQQIISAMAQVENPNSFAQIFSRCLL
ncbi:MAG: hypothetical protein ONB48_21865 [candidate division KSB1 bacterium]|nr:hypothetical protein [candidate division KSB1 bacterium]MDZ7305399.1 hypothetical protein [candidate division KSB1 bacterium]MDZ7351506.1 hypothetical protein [candidate division KSB1 bacterium]MDZ7355945.1 hypothetical protein [candidate division KSB1 bacterium]MDZ7384477.1 hypothetical protein [candidate division KSB1 bacterium]